MTSTEPLSSAPLSATIWDIESGADAIFGDSPYNFVATPPPSSTAFGKKLASVMDYLRQTVWPSIMDSVNLTPVQIVYKSQTVDPANRLLVTTTETTLDINGVVTGASAKNIERGLVLASEFECRVAAYDLVSVPTAKRDAIKVGGTNYDIIGIMPCPQVPPAIGYVFFLRRAV